MRLPSGGLTNYFGSCILVVVLAAFTVEVELESRSRIRLCRDDRYSYGKSDGCIGGGPACRVVNRVVIMAAFKTFHSLASCPV